MKLLVHRARTAATIARDLAALRRDDVWLATFPKTGSSWVRTLVASLAHGDGSTLAAIDEELPALGAGTLGRPWTGDPVPRLVKTHHAYRPVLFGRPTRTLLLTRDPRDTLASLHHMLSHRRIARFEGSLADLVRHPRLGLDAYLRHYASWAPRATAVLRYEDLHADPATALGEALGTLGVEIPGDRLAAAVERSSLARMRKREAEAGIANDDRFDDGFAFVRTGDRRAEAERFSEADEALYQTLRRRAGFEVYP